MNLNSSKFYILLLILSLSFSCTSQNSSSEQIAIKNKESQRDSVQELKMLFIGDIMEHDLQVQSSYNSQRQEYDFSEQFKDIQPIINDADVTIANFEVTLSLEPYKGYPKFSSPDKLAVAVKESGIDYLGLANNHINDYSQRGFNRTIRIIDSVGLHRTGVFYDEKDKDKHNPMIIEKNGFKIAVFNYTYGLNNDTLIAPNLVNFIDSATIKKDLTNVSKENYDAKIVFFHWGNEYERIEDSIQDSYANFCFDNGIDIIIGSHPHVIQPMKFYDYQMPDGTKKRVLVAFSLGNYVSNYGNWRYCDGGALFQFSLVKIDGKVTIKQPEYHLVWVYRKPKGNGLRHYYVLPVKSHKYDKYMSIAEKNQLQRFINDSRIHLKKNNINVTEADFFD